MSDAGSHPYWTIKQPRSSSRNAPVLPSPTMPAPQIFLLSPAKTGGERAQLLYSPTAKFDLARRLQSGERVPLAEVFSFLSGLYFRGKITYARAFARPPRSAPGALVITSHRGLLPVDTPVTLEEIRALSEVPIDHREARYVEPLQRDAAWLARVAGAKCRFVFLGSIGTPRYVDPLLGVFADRLLFPSAFVGRGDMSRGGLLLRAAAGGGELACEPVAGANRHGKRPAKLEPRSWGYQLLDGKTVLEISASKAPSPKHST